MLHIAYSKNYTAFIQIQTFENFPDLERFTNHNRTLKLSNDEYGVRLDNIRFILEYTTYQINKLFVMEPPRKV